MTEETSGMSPEERQELIAEFVGKGKNYLDQFVKKLSQIKKVVQKGEKITRSDFEELQQLMRTLNRMALCVDLSQTTQLTGACDSLLESIQKQQVDFTDDVVIILIATSKTLMLLIEELKKDKKEITNVSKDIKKIQSMIAPEELQSQIGKEDNDQGKNGSSKKKARNYSAIDEKYFGVYIDDTEQNIEKFNESLISLEKEPEDIENINNLFRLIHTIKGSSGMVNIIEVQEVSHKMESIFAIVRERKSAFKDMFPLLFKGIDTIDTLIRSLKKEKQITADIAPLIRELDDYLNNLPKVDKQKEAEVKEALLSVDDFLELLDKSEEKRDALAQATARGNEIFKITLSIDEKIPMKSMKVLLIEEHLKDEGTVVAMVPDSESINDISEGQVGVSVLFCTVMGEKDIRSLIFFDGVNILSIERMEPEALASVLPGKSKEAPSLPEEVVESTVSTKEKPVAQSPTIRIDTYKLDALMNLSGELITVRAKFENLLTLFNAEMVAQKDFVRDFENIQSNYEYLSTQLRGLFADTKENSEVKKILQSFDQTSRDISLLNQKTMKGRLWRQAHLMDETTGVLGKIASDIQASVMQARMIPIKGVFSRFSRIVRDISNDVGKNVNLVVEGEETELDKNLVDSLGDPLTHMVRNAIDHGIENPETRRMLGKPERGIITLRAFHQGNNICIVVADDGKGLNAEFLVQSALEKGLITKKQASQLTEKEKLELMFLPGFSTAAEVTNLSGRGVGMDVVRNMITMLNGTVNVDTQINRGTTFTLKIPLTLAIIQALLVVVGEEIYAIPLDSVVEIIKVTDDMIYSVDGNTTVKLREHALSLVRLENVIHIRGKNSDQQATKHMVVLSDGEKQVGVGVDGLIGESEIVIKSLSHYFSQVKGVSGVTILGDGQISLILDPKYIIMGTK